MHAYLFLGELTGALVGVNVRLAQAHVGETATHTLDGRESERNLYLSIDVRVHNTKNVLKLLGQN